MTKTGKITLYNFSELKYNEPIKTKAHRAERMVLYEKVICYDAGYGTAALLLRRL
jgi:hypothetical protein